MEFKNVGTIWNYNGRNVFILGNAANKNRTIWVADCRTGRSEDAPLSGLLPVRTRGNTVTRLTTRCIGWAAKGNAHAAWWLGWWLENEQSAKSFWYYLAAMRNDPTTFGWAFDRVYSDAYYALMREGIPTPCTAFLNDLIDLKEGKWSDWREAIRNAENAVDTPVDQSHLDEAMRLIKLSSPDEAHIGARRAGVPWRCLSNYAPYWEWAREWYEQQDKHGQDDWHVPSGESREAVSP